MHAANILTGVTRRPPRLPAGPLHAPEPPSGERYRRRRGRDPEADVLLPWSMAAIEHIERWAAEALTEACAAAMAGQALIPGWEPLPRWVRKNLELHLRLRFEMPDLKPFPGFAWFLSDPRILLQLLGDPPLAFLRAAFELHRKQFSEAGHLSTASLLADVAAFKRAISSLGHAPVEIGDDDDVMTGKFIELARGWVRKAQSAKPTRDAHRPRDPVFTAFIQGARMIYAREGLGEPGHHDVADLSTFCELELPDNQMDRRWKERLQRFARTDVGTPRDGERLTTG